MDEIKSQIEEVESVKTIEDESSDEESNESRVSESLSKGKNRPTMISYKTSEKKIEMKLNNTMNSPHSFESEEKIFSKANPNPLAFNSRAQS